MLAPFRSDYCKSCEIVTPDDGYHYFFGYYDLRADDGNGKYLCHRTSFWDRLPTKDDEIEVGYVENKQFFPIGKTTAWNFQQGALLQYHPTEKDTVFYNVFLDGTPRTVKHNYVTGEKTYTDRAVATISPDGKYGIAVNFGRIYDFRPGYGYAGCADPFRDVAAPHEDGAFLVDMETGRSTQILFYDTLGVASGFAKEEKVLINHVNFNTTGDRYVMLVRNAPLGECAGAKWSTSMVIGDLNGNVKTVLKNTGVSHYIWANADELIVFAKVNEKFGDWRINVVTGEMEEYDVNFREDIHCNLSPNGQYLIGDSYPVDENNGYLHIDTFPACGYRRVVAYSIKTKKPVILFDALTTIISPNLDIRCDLHARFTEGGKYISYDTTQNGKRQIAKVSTEALNF